MSVELLRFSVISIGGKSVAKIHALKPLFPTRDPRPIQGITGESWVFSYAEVVQIRFAHFK